MTDEKTDAVEQTEQEEPVEDKSAAPTEPHSLEQVKATIKGEVSKIGDRIRKIPWLTPLAASAHKTIKDYGQRADAALSGLEGTAEEEEPKPKPKARKKDGETK